MKNSKIKNPDSNQLGQLYSGVSQSTICKVMQKAGYKYKNLFNILGQFSIFQKLELGYFHNYPSDISRKQFEKIRPSLGAVRQKTTPS